MERLHPPEQSPEIDFTLDLNSKESYLTLPSYVRLHLFEVEILSNTPTVAIVQGQDEDGQTVTVELLAVDNQPDIPLQVLKVMIENKVVYEVTKH